MSTRTDALVSQQETGKITASIIPVVAGCHPARGNRTPCTGERSIRNRVAILTEHRRSTGGSVCRSGPAAMSGERPQGRAEAQAGARWSVLGPRAAPGESVGVPAGHPTRIAQAPVTSPSEEPPAQKHSAAQAARNGCRQPQVMPAIRVSYHKFVAAAGRRELSLTPFRLPLVFWRGPQLVPVHIHRGRPILFVLSIERNRFGIDGNIPRPNAEKSPDACTL